MAENKNLTECKDCGKEISKNAKACPHCGAERKKEPSGCAKVIGIIILLFIFTPIFAGVFSDANTNSTTTYVEDSQSESIANKKWISEISTSQMDDSKTVIIQNISESTVKYDGYRSAIPVLVLRCKENETDVFLDVDTMVDIKHDSNYNQYAKLELRLDDKPSKTVNSDVSNDNEAFFLRNPIGFIKGLLNSKALTARYTPYNGNTHTIKFDLTGLEDEITPLRQACGW